MHKLKKMVLFNLLADNLNRKDVSSIMTRLTSNGEYFAVAETDDDISIIYFEDDDKYEVIKYMKKATRNG